MTKTKNKQSQENSPFYYFYSTGCVFCKQVDKFVEELNKEGHDILRLDASEPENKEIIKEIKKEYNIKCGTPWLVNIKTGHNICGLRDKETIEKWLAGEKIEPLKRPNSPMPKPPFKGASKKEETKWKKDYKKWIEENSHLPNLKTSQEILDLPRPKSEPPKAPLANFTDEQFNDWAKIYDKWKDENSHLPNLQTSSVIIDRFKQQKQIQMSQSNGNIEQKINALDQKLNKLMSHLGVK